MSDTPNWAATVSVERNVPPSGDIVFVSIGAGGGAGALIETILPQLKLPISITPGSDKLRGGFYFASDQTPSVCFVVTTGKGDVAATLLTSLTAALRSKEAASARSIWMPLMGTGGGNLPNSQSLRTMLGAIQDSEAAFRPDLGITISAPPGMTEKVLERLKKIAQEASRSGITKEPPPAPPNSSNQPQPISDPVSKPLEGAFVPPREDNREVQDQVAGFTTDRVARDDLLDTIGDAKALARLICLKDAAPLAIAIFGGWGSGKSTFVELMEKEIDVVAGRKGDGWHPGAPIFIRDVVHIRFNAWQFADANLWLSLTAEFFDQLRAGGHNQTGTARYAELVRRVDRHAKALAAADATSNAAVAQATNQLFKAQDERDEAAEGVNQAVKKATEVENKDFVPSLYKEQKAQLQALGFSEQDDASVQRIVDLVGDSSSIVNYVKAFFQSAKTLNWRVKRAIVTPILLTVVIWVVFRTTDKQHLVHWVSAIGAALAILGTWTAAVLPFFKLVNAISERAAAMASAISSAKAEAETELSRKKKVLCEARAEAQASQEAAKDTSLSLAHYTNFPGASAGRRLLHYVLEDDPDTRQLQKELGLIDRTRRLFQAVNDIIWQELEQKELKRIQEEQAEKKKAEAAAQNPTTPEDKSAAENQRAAAEARAEAGKIDEVTHTGEKEKIPERIILYIDDLDRCSADQVYAVLQAIHLLLAFESFVVIVGVDVAWIENALARDLAGADVNRSVSDEMKNQRTSEYLEKIFQIAFWLNPLTNGANGDATYAQYLRGLVKAKPADNPNGSDGADAAPDFNRVANGARKSAAANGSRQRQSGEDGKNPNEPKEPPPGSEVPGLGLVQLEQVEIDFLASAEIAAIAPTTPRSVKRLLNIYRLVRTRLGGSGADLMGEKGPAVYPLIALASALETRQAERTGHALVNVADLFYKFAKETPPKESLEEHSPSRSMKPSDLSKAVFQACPGLKEALPHVANEGKAGVMAADVVRVLNIARRYSFNRPDLDNANRDSRTAASTTI